MTPTDPSRAVVLLGRDGAPDDLDHGLDRAARALGVARLAPARPRHRTGPALATWPFVVEELADGLGRERFSVLARGRDAALGLAVAYVLPHRTEALGLLAPEGRPPAAAVDAAGLTVPTLVWPGGDAAVWVAAVPGARMQAGADDAGRILRRLLAAAR